MSAIIIIISVLSLDLSIKMKQKLNGWFYKQTKKNNKSGRDDTLDNLSEK